MRGGALAKISAKIAHKPGCGWPTESETMIPALVRAGIGLAEDTRFELVRV